METDKCISVICAPFAERYSPGALEKKRANNRRKVIQSPACIKRFSRAQFENKMKTKKKKFLRVQYIRTRSFLYARLLVVETTSPTRYGRVTPI